MLLGTLFSDRDKRNVLVLATCQALFMSVMAMNIATTPLAGHMLLGADKSFATLPLFLMHASIMAATIPASMLMHRFGRRAGFSIGACIGILAGIVVTIGIFRQSFSMLCLGMVLQGTASGFAWYYRFAAADTAAPAFKAKALSLVLAGGIVAGIVGTETAKWANDLFAPVMFAGVYLMGSIFWLGVLIFVQGTRIPKLTKAERATTGRPLSQIARQPTFIVALCSSMFGYGVMTLLMTATPIAMLSCGFGYNDSTTVIQAHVIAMFLPAFFTGSLISRFGALPIIIIGALIQAACAIVNISGINFANFYVGLALLGVGWNFTYVGGSTLLTSTYEPAERAKVQATHDFTVFATTALSAAAAGILQQFAGWSLINVAALPLMAMIIVAAGSLLLKQRRQTLMANT